MWKALPLLALNAVLIGLWLWGGGPPYSSAGQRVWYHDVPWGFMAVGVVLPGIILGAAGDRKKSLPLILNCYSLVVLLAFLIYVFNSGGGI